MEKKATIYGVAEKAGVSITTVSRFLNSPEKVSSQTKERIKDAMHSLEFVPNAEAVIRARNGVRRIGVLSPYFTAPSFIQRMRGIQKVISNNGFDMVTYAVESREQLEANLHILPVSNRIDGLINLSLPLLETDIEGFTKNNIPVVSIESDLPGVTSIVIDDWQGGGMAAAHLLEKGYRRLCFVGETGQPPYTMHNNRRRLEGFQDEIKRQGYALEKNRVHHHYYGLDNTEACIRKVLMASDKPDAIFFSSDLQAMVALKVARELGISIPGELGIIGFDDIDVSKYMDITTINQSLDYSGSTAAELLLRLLKNPEEQKKTIKLELKVVQRYTS